MDDPFFPELNDPARPAAARPVSPRPGRGGAGAARGRRIDMANRRIRKSLSGETSATDLPGQQRRGLAKSVWQAGATGPARVPTVEHPPLCTGEKRNVMRGREAAVWCKGTGLM